MAAHPAAVRVSIAGSARRFRETVRDLDLIATATDAPALIDAFCSFPWVVEVAAKGDTKATVVAHDGLRYDLRVVPPESLREPAAALHRLEEPQRRACARRPCGAGSRSPSTASPRSRPARCTRSRTRRTSTRFLGYEWIPPELRENGGELEAARNGALPKLVELEDLRGDLHTHTTWSDGKDTLDAMVARAVEKGYEYYAICDHSQRLRDERLEQQHAAIDALNEQVPIALLKGIEVNIRVERRARRGRRDPRAPRLGRRVGAQLASRRTRPAA